MSEQRGPSEGVAALATTILTWPTTFSLDLAQEHKNFTCLDDTAESAIHLELREEAGCPGFSRELWSRDDRYLVAFEPRIARGSTATLELAGRRAE